MTEQYMPLKKFYCVVKDTFPRVYSVYAAHESEALYIAWSHSGKNVITAYSEQDLEGRIICHRCKRGDYQANLISKEHYNLIKENTPYLLDDDTKIIDVADRESIEDIALKVTFDYFKSNCGRKTYEYYVNEQNKKMLDVAFEFSHENSGIEYILTGSIAAVHYGIKEPVFDIDLYVVDQAAFVDTCDLLMDLNCGFIARHEVNDPDWKGSSIFTTYKGVGVNIFYPKQIGSYALDFSDRLAHVVDDDRSFNLNVLEPDEYIRILQAKGREKDLRRIEQLNNLFKQKQIDA